MRIAFLLTTHNRIEKTIKCIKSLQRAIAYAKQSRAQLEIEDEWYITDAGSTDGTAGAIKAVVDASKLHMYEGDEDIFYSQGMRKSMEMYYENAGADTAAAVNADAGDFHGSYYMLINDDVEFYEDCLYRMILDAFQSSKTLPCNDRIIVGAMDYNGSQTYGGIRYNYYKDKKTFGLQKISYKMVTKDEADRKCHTFNANCVLIPESVIHKIGIMDDKFVHSLGDFDYGMRINKAGYTILATDYYVGSCPNNSRKGTWMDNSLSRSERIAKLRSVKGAPTTTWFYYLNKHFGFVTACVYSISPYVRIILGK